MNRSDMKLPTRSELSVDRASSDRNSNQRLISQPIKRKPPPRPPPPNFNKIKSKSAWNLNNVLDNRSSINVSPLESPSFLLSSRNDVLGGNVLSSFSSSTSSLASSKQSFEYEGVSLEHCTLNPASSSTVATSSLFYVSNGQSRIPAPTIIRPQIIKRSQTVKSAFDLLQRDSSLPMPSIPPPSPPKETEEVTVPYGIALYDYKASHKDDLSFKINEVIFLIRRINSEWLYGRIEDREGLFPNNHISIQVPLSEEDRLVTALYEFTPQAIGDLALKPGQQVLVTGRVSTDWLIGESNGCSGQFPAAFVDRTPSI